MNATSPLPTATEAAIPTRRLSAVMWLSAAALLFALFVWSNTVPRVIAESLRLSVWLTFGACAIWAVSIFASLSIFLLRTIKVAGDILPLAILAALVWCGILRCFLSPLGITSILGGTIIASSLATFHAFGGKGAHRLFCAGFSVGAWFSLGLVLLGHLPHHDERLIVLISEWIWESLVFRPEPSIDAGATLGGLTGAGIVWLLAYCTGWITVLWSVGSANRRSTQS
jgi:hypothetical protein